MALLALLCAGCQNTNSDSESGSSAAQPSLAEQVSKLTSLSQEIETAFTGGVPQSAHDPLHAVAHLLNELPASAASAGLDEEAQSKIQTAAGQLFDAYEKLDGAVHGTSEADGEAVYEEVRQTISDGLQQIQSAASQ